MNSNEFRQAMDELAAFHYRGGTRGKQGRSPLQRLLQPFDEDIDTYLHSQFGGLCAYTEVALDPDERLSVAWHRPPSNATTTTGDVSSEHYWWLALDWRNWYTASSHVVSVKGNSFPVLGDRMAVPVLAEPEMPRRRGRLDQGLILDPCSDSPSYWIRYNDNGRVEPRQHVLGAFRGRETIVALDLDNEVLQDSRAASIRAAARTFPKGDAGLLARFLRELTSAGTPHTEAIAQSLVRRQLRLQPAMSPSEVEDLISVCPEQFLTEFAESRLKLTEYTPEIRRMIVALAEQQFNTMANESFDVIYDELFEPVHGVVRVRPASGDVATLDPTQNDELMASSENRRTINTKTTISASSQISRIEIKNFRAIVHIVLDLAPTLVDLIDVLDLDEDERVEVAKLEGRRWKMLLGENGSGKSSVLHAVGLALAGAGIENAMATAELTWDDLLRWQADDEDERAEGQIRLDFSGGTRIDLRFDANGHRFHGLGTDAPAIHLNIRGYGAARFPATKRTATTAEVLTSRVLDDTSTASCNIDNLLDSTVPILNAAEWLGRLEDPEFNVAAETISDLLGESSLVLLDPHANNDPGVTTGQRITREAFVPTNAGSDEPPEPRKVLVDDEPLSLVSDGYRSVIALGCEIMAGVGGLASESGGTSDIRAANGIVLLDEIGAHLHPRWRMQITGKLRKAFPLVQFFVTTHEPLCLRGLVENEVVRVTKYEKHGVLLDEIDRAPGRYRVDQLLTSEFFGLNSAIDPRVDRLFTEYYKLKRHARPSSAVLERISTLEEQINDRALRPVLGYTRRDQLIFEAIDGFLVDDALHTALPKDRREEREKIVRKVASIWNRTGDGTAT